MHQKSYIIAIYIQYTSIYSRLYPQITEIKLAPKILQGNFRCQFKYNYIKLIII